MIALNILDIKDFMNKLLRTEVFDHFLLQEASISGHISYLIDGHLNMNFYAKEELEELELNGLTFTPFSMVRNHCYDLIKGKRTPTSFKFVFLLSPKNLERTLAQTTSGLTPSDITAVYLNLKYQNQQLVATTGVSYSTFVLDKSFEFEWDTLIKKFLRNNAISFEEL
ncbi:MAG: DUF5721 family protein [Roseburia sp.]